MSRPWARAAAPLNAIAAAIGDEAFRRMPVQADIILARARSRTSSTRTADCKHLGATDMAVIFRDMMPAFELFQPANIGG